MPENITDIEKWNNAYPFLKEVWTTYKKFDKKFEDDNHKYDIICDYFVLKGSNEDINKYSQFCKKLMRNLGHSLLDSQNYEFTQERCNILYYWIYNSINEDNNTHKILNQCFDVYNTYMDGINNKKKCYNFLNYNIYDPIKVTLLDIFQDNMQNIINKLIREFDSTKLPFRTFVCECVKIYKYMNELYCLNGNKRSERHITTCLKLDQFKGSYKHFLTNLGSLYPNIPLLDDEDKDLSAKCPPDERDKLLRSSKVETRGPSLENGLSARAGYGDHTLTDGLPETLEMVDNSMKKTITTTIGTFAGASSLLAFLYKFTPAGRLVNPKLRTTGITNNNFYGEESNGMLFDGNEHNGFNSYNIGYEAV